MNWGYSIVIAFILFAAFLAVIVSKAMNEDLALTSADYYQQELEYGNKMILTKNYLNLKIKPTVQYDQGIIKIKFGQAIENAVISFYKPNNSKEDFKISTKDTVVLVPFSSKSKGLWKVRLDYTINQTKVFQEEVTFID